MDHFDYSEGLVLWQDAPIEKRAYTVYDPEGRLVKVTEKKLENHDSWEPVQGDPAFHYNVGSIITNPDKIIPDNSKNPKAIAHRETGLILTYVKYNFIMSLNMPSSPQFPSDMTTVTVKYDHSGDNFTLTHQVFKNT